MREVEHVRRSVPCVRPRASLVAGARSRRASVGVWWTLSARCGAVVRMGCWGVVLAMCGKPCRREVEVTCDLSLRRHVNMAGIVRVKAACVCLRGLSTNSSFPVYPGVPSRPPTRVLSSSSVEKRTWSPAIGPTSGGQRVQGVLRVQVKLDLASPTADSRAALRFVSRVCL
jgi:hypothetical protein